MSGMRSEESKSLEEKKEEKKPEMDPMARYLRNIEFHRSGNDFFDKNGHIQRNEANRLIAIPFTNKSEKAGLLVRKMAYKWHHPKEKEKRRETDMPCKILTRGEDEKFSLVSNHKKESTEAPSLSQMYAIVDHPSAIKEPGELQLRIAEQSHYACANGHSHAYAAGYITLERGVITKITNDAGGYHLNYDERKEGRPDSGIEKANLKELFCSMGRAFERCGVLKELFTDVFKPVAGENVTSAWSLAQTELNPSKYPPPKEEEKKEELSFKDLPPILIPVGPPSPRVTTGTLPPLPTSSSSSSSSSSSVTKEKDNVKSKIDKLPPVPRSNWIFSTSNKTLSTASGGKKPTDRHRPKFGR
jgi:hypothetical protein